MVGSVVVDHQEQRESDQLKRDTSVEDQQSQVLVVASSLG